MHRNAKGAMVVGYRTVMGVFQGRKLGVGVAGLYCTHHADDKNACDRNYTQPDGPLPITSSELKQIPHESSVRFSIQHTLIGCGKTAVDIQTRTDASKPKGAKLSKLVYEEDEL
jgi:hypothetical protein